MTKIVIRLSNYYGELNPDIDYEIDDLLDEIDRLDYALDEANEKIES